MSELEGFLQAIDDDPADETNWLVMADWLEDNGDPRREEAADEGADEEDVGRFGGGDRHPARAEQQHPAVDHDDAVERDEREHEQQVGQANREDGANRFAHVDARGQPPQDGGGED